MGGETGVGTRPELVAYRLTAGAAMPIVPASANRVWMDETIACNANRCLPMLMANQAHCARSRTEPRSEAKRFRRLDAS